MKGLYMNALFVLVQALLSAVMIVQVPFMQSAFAIFNTYQEVSGNAIFCKVIRHAIPNKVGRLAPN